MRQKSYTDVYRKVWQNKRKERTEMNYCFGVDIGGTTVKIGLFQEDGNVREKWEIKT